MIAMYMDAGSTDIPTLLTHNFASETFPVLGIQSRWRGAQTLMWFAFFASFAVKMPMWPVHTWLPDAHVQAPTAGSVVLAAILLKMGGYGFLRFSLPMFPVASDLLANFVLWVSAIAIVYTSLVALAQEDMKKLIAYSSVAHMGYVTAGIFAVNQQGIDGAIFPDAVPRLHIRRALFVRRRHLRPDAHPRHFRLWRPRQPDAGLCADLHAVYAGQCRPAGHLRICRRVPDAGRHIPGQHLGGRRCDFGRYPVVRPYALWLYRRVVLGELIKESLKSITDMSARERWIFAPLVVMTILLGVYPALVTDIIGPSVAALLDNYQSGLPVGELAMADQAGG